MRDHGWLMARETGNGGWFIVISGFDGAEPPATASFIWPEKEPLKIPSTMVLLTVAEFTDLLYQAKVQTNPGPSLTAVRQ